MISTASLEPLELARNFGHSITACIMKSLKTVVWLEETDQH